MAEANSPREMKVSEVLRQAKDLPHSRFPSADAAILKIVHKQGEYTGKSEWLYREALRYFYLGNADFDSAIDLSEEEERIGPRFTKLEKEVADLRETLEYHIELAPGHDIDAQEGR